MSWPCWGVGRTSLELDHTTLPSYVLHGKWSNRRRVPVAAPAALRMSHRSDPSPRGQPAEHEHQLISVITGTGLGPNANDV